MVSIGCNNDRNLTPPKTNTNDNPPQTEQDGGNDTGTSTSDTDTWPNGDVSMEDMRIRLIDSVFIGSNAQLFVSVTTKDGVAVESLDADDFTVLEDGNSLSVESGLDIQKRPSNFVWRTLMIFDTSYSIMATHNVEVVVEPSRTLTQRILQADSRALRVSVASFDGAPTLRPLVKDIDDNLYFTANRNKLDCDLNNFLNSQCSDHDNCEDTRPECINGLCIDRSTNLYGSVIQGIQEVETAVTKESRIGVPRGGSLVIFTDGSDQAGRKPLPSVIEKIRETSVYVFAVGVSGEIDTKVLDQIGRDGTVYISGLDELDSAMDQIWTMIENIGSGIYLISYCTPTRSGDHTISVRLTGTTQNVTVSFKASDDAMCDPGEASSACEGLSCGKGTDNFYCGDCAGDSACSEVGKCERICDTSSCGFHDNGQSPIDCGCCADGLTCNVDAGTCF